METVLLAANDVLSGPGIVLLLAGCLLALVLGILPGLSSTEAMIILLPFTFALGLNESMILLCAAYAAAFVGGAITSIVFGIPGSSTGLATQLDGHPLHRQGLTIYAVTVAAVASAAAGLLSLLLVAVLLPSMQAISLLFGPAEWFAFVILGLVLLAFSSEGTFTSGLVAAGLGLLLGVIGLSVVTGFPRFTFGLTEMWGGVPIVAAFVGLYPLTEAFHMALAGRRPVAAEARSTVTLDRREDSRRQMGAGIRDTLRYSGTWSGAGLIGWLVGVIPGVGGVLANILGYIVVRETSRDKSKFGKGEVRGLIASEAANNGSVGGALVPALALGIPGSLNAAILLGVFMINGVQPGANIFAEHLQVTWVILLSTAVATVLASVLVMAGGWRLILVISRISPVLVAPFIVFLGCIAVLLARGNPFDLVFAAAMTLIGLTCKRYNFSRISLVIALMLGALVESSYFQALAIGRGSYAVFLASTTSIVIWLTVAAAAVLHMVRARSRYRDVPLGSGHG